MRAAGGGHEVGPAVADRALAGVGGGHRRLAVARRRDGRTRRGRHRPERLKRLATGRLRGLTSRRIGHVRNYNSDREY